MDATVCFNTLASCADDDAPADYPRAEKRKSDPPKKTGPAPAKMKFTLNSAANVKPVKLSLSKPQVSRTCVKTPGVVSPLVSNPREAVLV